jgi:hypothetical protein
VTVVVGSKTDQNLTIGGDILSNIVGLWHFDEGTGIYAYDTSGQGNIGTLGSTHSLPTWTTGKFGNALNFTSGAGNGCSVDLAGVASGTSFTISAWINPILRSAWSGIVTQDSSNGFFVSPTNHLAYYRSSGGDVLESSHTFTNGQWSFVTMVSDSSNITLYINGSSDGTTVYSTASMNCLMIGNDNGNKWYQGTMDDVRIYTRALSSTEVAELYNQSVVINNENDIIDIVPLSGLVGCWHFDEGTSTTAHDASISGATGTLYNNTGGTVGWDVGKLGYCALFTYTGPNNPAYIQTSDPSGTLRYVTNPITIAVWVKVRTPGSYMPIIQRTGATGNNGFYYDGVNHLIYFEAGAYADGFDYSVSKNLNDSAWHYIEASYDAPAINQAGTVRIYCDGILLLSQGSVTVTSYADTIGNDWHIGICWGGAPGWDGWIDEARIYNRALSDGGVSVGQSATGEIAQLYNEGLERGDFMMEGLLDLRNMLAGDTTVITEYMAIDNSNSHIYQQTTYSGAQVASLVRFHGKIYYKKNLYKVTLKQTAGTGKSYPVTSLMQVINY